MAKVLSIVAHERFEEAGVALPEALDFHFRDARREGDVIESCRGMDFLLLPAAYPLITARILENIPTVRMIQSAGAGYDQVDTDSAARLHIPVANSPGHNSTAVAEFTMALLIALQRHLVIADREIKAGNYKALRAGFFRSGLAEVRGTRIGLVGFGGIGREVARLAGLLGAQVVYTDLRRATESVEAELQAGYRTFHELIETSEAVSLHVPLSDGTRALIGPREFRLMRPGALIINTSRGEVLDQEALARALEAGKLGGAAIDTVSPEPPPPDHPLLKLSPPASDRLLITPHIAGITRGAMSRMLTAALSNMARVAGGGPPANVVNGVRRARTPE